MTKAAFWAVKCLETNGIVLQFGVDEARLDMLATGRQCSHNRRVSAALAQLGHDDITADGIQVCSVVELQYGRQCSVSLNHKLCGYGLSHFD